MLRALILTACLALPLTALADDTPESWLAKLPAAPGTLAEAQATCADSTNYKLASFDRHIDFAISEAQGEGQANAAQAMMDLATVQQYLYASDLSPSQLGADLDTASLDAQLQKQEGASDQVRAGIVDAWLRRVHADWLVRYAKLKQALSDPKAPRPSKKPGDGGIGASGQQQLLAARLQAIKTLADQGGQICSEAVERAPATE